MELNDLFAGRFDAYFGAAQADDPLWLFVHVPKTAGSSLNGELQPIMAPYHHIFINYAELDPSEATQSYEQLFDRAIDRFIEKAQARRYRYCTGHINALQVERIAANVPNVRPITLLREPVSRYISDYRYQRSTMHPGHEQFRAEYPRIEDYLKLQSDWNKIATTLLPPDLRAGGDVQACVQWLTSTYVFIGVQEMYGLCLHALSWFAGVPKRSRVRRRINDPTPDNEVILSYDLQEEIRVCNALDVALYEAIAPRFMAISDLLTSYLDRVAPRPPRA
ncbi:MAG: hypothetical protein WDN04_04645 [Rhodospirillales bacterium]